MDDVSVKIEKKTTKNNYSHHTKKGPMKEMSHKVPKKTLHDHKYNLPPTLSGIDSDAQ